MRLHLLLAKVQPEQITEPTHCVDPQCKSQKFRLHQPVKKARRDTVSHEVQVSRYQCLKCKRTFRVYPPGVTAAQTSLRVKGLAVMLYLLG
jgi:transposase-like protein